MTQRRSLHGQVLLARAIPGAEISISLPGGGTPLATTTADQSGDFSFENLTLPENFTVSAKIGGTVLATEVRDFSGTSRYVVINVPTSLTSLYMRQNGTSLQEAEERIRRVLGIKDDRSLEYGCHESVREPFSHVAFFSMAARHGGPTALGQSLVRYASTSVPRPLKFRLTRRSAARAFDTEPAVKQVLTSFLAEPFIRHSFTSTGSRAFPNYASVLAGRRVNLSLVESDNENFIQQAEDDIVEVGEELLQDAAKCGPADDAVPAVESLESELTGTLSNVSGATVNILEEGEKDLGAVGVTQLVAIGWTQIASCLNLNYGTSVMLANIQEQLGEVATELTDLDLKATEYELLTLQSNISNSVESIKTLFATYQSNCDATVVSNPQTPYDSATDSKGVVTTWP